LANGCAALFDGNALIVSLSRVLRTQVHTQWGGRISAQSDLCVLRERVGQQLEGVTVFNQYFRFAIEAPQSHLQRRVSMYKAKSPDADS
jgi:hypothetical protein